MALKPCRECGAQVSDAAEICPHCGVRAPAAAPVVPRRRLGCGRICLLGLFALFLITVISNRSRIEQITPEQQAVKQKEEAAEQERKRKEAEANAVEQNRAAVAKAAEDKRIEESNKKWFDTLRSAALDAMLIDPHLK